jgi:parvulin-like peptidyl-prolyl isomerase
VKTSSLTKLLLAAIFAASVGLGAAQTTSSTPPAVKAADVAKVMGASKSADVQKLVDQFSAKRDAMIADRQALVNQLKAATADQRKAILEKMRAQEKEVVEAQRALGKQLRDELRQLRLDQLATGHR